MAEARVSRMGSIRVRHAVADDTGACLRLMDRAWHAGHPYAPRVFNAEVWIRETRGERVLVAENEQGEILGFAGVYVPDSFIHHLYVDPDAWGQGVGRALLEASVELVGGAAHLKCQQRNARAMGFYSHVGWVPADEGVNPDTGPWRRFLSPTRRLDGRPPEG